MQAPTFAAPRPALPQSAVQQPKPDTKPSRHSAPGPSNVANEEEADAAVSRPEAQAGTSKGVIRHSLPCVPRKPLACVSSNVLPKAKVPDNGDPLFGNTRSASEGRQAADETLPIRKRKLEANAAVRATPVRAAQTAVINDDDDDFA